MNFLKFLLIFLTVIFSTTKKVIAETTSRSEICSTLSTQETYDIQINSYTSGGGAYFESTYHYIPISYSYENLNYLTIKPNIRISVPAALANSITLCCGDSQSACSLSCSDVPVVIEPGGNNLYYDINLSESRKLCYQIQQWGVMYTSFQLRFETNPSFFSTKAVADITLGFYDCSGYDVVQFANTAYSPTCEKPEPDTEVVKIRRISVLKETEISMFQPAARLINTKQSEDTTITVENSDGSPNGLFYINSDDGMLKMKTGEISLMETDKIYNLKLKLDSGGNQLPLSVVARAENRYSPVFLSCSDPSSSLYIETDKQSCLNRACSFGTFEVADYDGDVLQTSNFTIHHVSGLMLTHGSIENYFYSDLESQGYKTDGASLYLFRVYQRYPFSENDLLNLAKQNGPKGFLLIQANVFDNRVTGSKSGSCTIRISMPSLSHISSKPTFISPSKPIRIALPYGFWDAPEPIIRVLAVDRIYEKLALDYPDAKPTVTYEVEEPTSSFDISETGEITVMSSLDHQADTYNLTVIAKLHNYSNRQSSVNIVVDVLSQDSTKWTPRFDPTQNYETVLTDGPYTNSYLMNKVRFKAPGDLEGVNIGCKLADCHCFSSPCADCPCMKKQYHCEVDNDDKQMINVRVSSCETPELGVNFDYSEERIIHVLLTVTDNKYTMQTALQFKLEDANSKSVSDYGTVGFTVPESNTIPELMVVKLFDRDLKANMGIGCKATVSCSSSQGGSDMFQYITLDSKGAGYIRFDNSFSPGAGECKFYAYDSKWSEGLCVETNQNTYPNMPGRSSITILEEPQTASPVSLFCPDAVAQYSTLFTPLERCQVASVESGMLPTGNAADNIYYFVTDPSGTFAANTTTGSLYLLQPIIPNDNTFTDEWAFPLELSVFNGRFWSMASISVRVKNSYISRSKIEDVFELSTDYGTPAPASDDPYLIHVPVASAITLETPILTITQTVEAAAKGAEPFLDGSASELYDLQQLDARTWVLTYKGGTSRKITTTQLYTFAQVNAIVGTRVSIATKYILPNPAANGKSVTLGTTAELCFYEAQPATKSSFDWYWILLIVFAVVLFIIITILIFFLMARRRKKKDVSDVSHPVNYVAREPTFTPSPGSTSVTSHVEDPALARMLATRLAGADMTMTSPSNCRAVRSWQDDDGLDTVTIASGFTDAPLNLAVLNQYGPDYSALAENWGVARRV